MANKCILIVEDEKTWAELWVDLLDNYDCDNAYSLKEATDKLCHKEYSLIISDLRSNR